MKFSSHQFADVILIQVEGRIAAHKTAKILNRFSRVILLAGMVLLAFFRFEAAAYSAGTTVKEDAGRPELSRLEEVARQAYIWGYPLVRWAHVRHYLTSPDDPFKQWPPTIAAAPMNRMGNSRALSSPESTMGPGPNNDTLYSSAIVDVSGNASYVLETPDFGDRYYTFQIIETDSSSDTALGQRTHGGQLPPVFLYGPDYTGAVPDGMIPIQARGRYLTIGGRLLVTGMEDMPEVHKLQDKIRLRTLRSFYNDSSSLNPIALQRPLRDPKSDLQPELAFYEMLGNVMGDWHATGEEKTLVASFAPIGLTPEEGFRPDTLSADEKAAVVRGFKRGNEKVEWKSRNLGVNKNGWTINFHGSKFGNDYLLRAGVAKDQIGVLPPEEAIYPLARTDAAGESLDGANAYRIVLAKDKLPPVKAFWSITLYDDNGFMVANPENKYAVGDRTSDLVVTEHGSIEIRMQRKKPESRSVNWLPAPEGPFYLMMRLYIPEEAVLDQSWMPPAIEKIK